MEIDVVRHDAVASVLQCHFDSVAYAHADHRPRNFPIEGPVVIGRTVSELAGQFDGLKMNLYRLRPSPPNGSRKVAGVANDVGDRYRRC